MKSDTLYSMIKKIILLSLVVLIGVAVYFWKFNIKQPVISNPEPIGNEQEKIDLIQVESPRPNTEISSPIIIKGKARGTWFFEGSFPIKLLDDKNVVIANTIAKADGEWMTQNFVPFTAILPFSSSGAKKGKLILQKDNPSALPENEDFLEIPLRFRQ